MSADVRPYKESALSKKQQIARMFNNIAWRYDFLNHFLSLGIDRYWRKTAIRELSKARPVIILDVATGTGDFAINALNSGASKIFGIDISEDMLAIGRKKIRKKNLHEKIELLEGDSESMIFEDNKFDAVTVAFGVRNFENLRKGLNEMRRVLKPDGKAVILEFSQPSPGLIRSLYNFYSGRITPGLGRFISRDISAYKYLKESVDAFPYGGEFLRILQETGFRDLSMKRLTFGIATVYTAVK